MHSEKVQFALQRLLVNVMFHNPRSLAALTCCFGVRSILVILSCYLAMVPLVFSLDL